MQRAARGSRTDWCMRDLGKRGRAGKAGKFLINRLKEINHYDSPESFTSSEGSYTDYPFTNETRIISSKGLDEEMHNVLLDEVEPEYINIGIDHSPMRGWACFFEQELDEWKDSNFGDKDLKWKIRFGIACWSLWFGRNDFIFNNIHVSRTKMASQIERRAHEIQRSEGCLRVSGLKNRKFVALGWEKPDLGWVKLNCDGAASNDHSKAAAIELREMIKATS
ncbi:hypothetical protein Scep_028272 [Stephania cephalantha]|uniref:Uncharacterized protein n=1 Tax=Stephania cephalantha TaxID=152367 RepID=A0AAP0HNB1_9MAGN